MKNKTLLSIMMLVSNREDTIERCLESLVPILKNIPSELIVVDTAENQKCMEVVRRYTDKIVRFEWCKDFAAARNAGLAIAQGEWLMIIDDDEWFEDATEIWEFFKNGTYKKYSSASYYIRNYADKAGKVWGDRTSIRLSRRFKESHYFGRVHEQLYPLEEPTYFFKAYVHHYGYAYESEEESVRHSWRNIDLLLECKKEEPQNWRAKTHLLQEYAVIHEYFSAISVAKELLADETRYEKDRRFFTAYAQIMLIDLLHRQKNYQEAYDTAQKILQEKILLVSELCIVSLLPDICQKLERYEEGIRYTDEYFRLLAVWNRKPEENDHTDAFNITKYYIHRSIQQRNLLLTLFMATLLERWEKAGQAFLEISWDDLSTIFENTPRCVVQTIANNEYSIKFTEALDTLLKNDTCCQAIREGIAKLSGQQKERVAYAVLQIETPDKNIMEYQLQLSADAGDKQMLYAMIDRWQGQNYSCFLFQREVWHALKRLQISLYPYVQDIGIQEWQKLSEALFDSLTEEECECAYQVLTGGMNQGDIRFLHITGLWLEKKLLKRDMRVQKVGFLEMESIWKELYQISSLWVSCAAMLYQERVFQDVTLQSALPERYRFAWLVFQANAVKADTLVFVRKIAEAAKSYLRMDEVCKYLLRCCKTEGEQQ